MNVKKTLYTAIQLGLLIIFLLCNTAVYAGEKVTIYQSKSTLLSGMIYRPLGKGPFPAVVALHGCAGFDGKANTPNARDVDWSERLSKIGFIVLLPDSFGSRHVGSQCNNATVRPDVERVADALAAKNYLQARPDVNPKAISIMGWSNGASAVLYTIDSQQKNILVPDFNRAVAFYPNCRQLAKAGAYHSRMPLLLLIGDHDQYMSVAACKILIKQAESADQQAEIIIYPGANHSFDQPNLKPWTNPAARADVLKRVPIFLLDK